MTRTAIVISRSRLHASGSGNLKSMMEQAGLVKVEYFKSDRWVVALHRGFKI